MATGRDTEEPLTESPKGSHGATKDTGWVEVCSEG